MQYKKVTISTLTIFSFFKCCPREISKIVSDQETKLKWMIEICLKMVSFCQPSLPVLTGSLKTNKGNKFSIFFLL